MKLLLLKIKLVSERKIRPSVYKPAMIISTTKLNATKIFAGNPDLEMITSIIPVVCLLLFFRRPDNRDVVSYVSSLFKFSCTK